MGLTQLEMNEANNILNDTGRSQQERTRDFYQYLEDRGEDYGRLGGGVTDNDTWQGSCQIKTRFLRFGDKIC